MHLTSLQKWACLFVFFISFGVFNFLEAKEYVDNPTQSDLQKDWEILQDFRGLRDKAAQDFRFGTEDEIDDRKKDIRVFYVDFKVWFKRVKPRHEKGLYPEDQQEVIGKLLQNSEEHIKDKDPKSPCYDAFELGKKVIEAISMVFGDTGSASAQTAQLPKLSNLHE